MNYGPSQKFQLNRKDHDIFNTIVDTDKYL